MIAIGLLATEAIAALVSLFKKGVDNISGEASKDLYHWVREKFINKNKHEDLKQLEKAPDNQKLQGKVEAILDDIILEINKNRSQVEELSKLIESSKKEITINNSNNNIIEGSFNNIQDSNIDVRYNSPTNIYQHSEPSAEQLLTQGKNLLKKAEYKNALEKFSQVLNTDYGNEDVYYYMALSMINGKRPKTLDPSKAKDILRILNLAIERDNSKAHYYYLKAIILYDFYYLNFGSEERIPEINKALKSAANAEHDQVIIKDMLKYTPNIDSEIYDCIFSG